MADSTIDQALQDHFEHLLHEVESRPLAERFVPRRFKAVDELLALSADEWPYRGLFRNRDPQLPKILEHSRLLVLGEPGAGKSTVAWAAAEHLARQRSANGVPVFASLRSYDGNLRTLLETSANPDILDCSDITRAYILDGVDEVPEAHRAALAPDLKNLLQKDKKARCLATSRQAFYIEHPGTLPPGFTAFQLLDFSDEDIREYATKHGLDVTGFWNALRDHDCLEEVRNPFTLSVMASTFRREGRLRQTKSDNVSLMIDELINSRKELNARRQRRAIRMLAITMETCCRNELTLQEAKQVLMVSMSLDEAAATKFLDELTHSILVRTKQGIAFQARSYGEYLAAEELENHGIDRLRHLAFLPDGQPNDSWQNAVTYLAEINSDIRQFFIKNYPTWMLSVSPAVFLDGEKEALVRRIVELLDSTGEYAVGRRDINIRRLSRLLTESTAALFQQHLDSPKPNMRASALVVLATRKDPNVKPKALPLVLATTDASPVRHSAIIALILLEDASVLDSLLGAVNTADPFHAQLLDCIGTLATPDNLSTVLPLILSTQTGLSATFYHFEELRSRDAVLAVLRYLEAKPDTLNSIRADGYLKPIIRSMRNTMDDETVSAAADVIVAVERRGLFLDRSGVAPTFFAEIRRSARAGDVCRLVLETFHHEGITPRRVDEELAQLVDRDTARWLIEARATELIKGLSWMIFDDEVRQMLAPYSEGAIEAQDANRRQREKERQERVDKKLQETEASNQHILESNDMTEVLITFKELRTEEWPDLPPERASWLGNELTRLLQEMQLDTSILYVSESSWNQPGPLNLVLALVDHYNLFIKDDTTLIAALKAWPEKTVSNHYQRHGLSPAAKEKFEGFLADETLNTSVVQHVLMFVDETGYASPGVVPALKKIIGRADLQVHVKEQAARILGQTPDTDDILDGLRTSSEERVRDSAFRLLIKRQHRPTIERGLQALLDDSNLFKSHETAGPHDTALNWIRDISRLDSWDKLKKLREVALKQELPGLAGLVTDTMARIDIDRMSAVITQQLSTAPASWRQYQLNLVSQYAREARMLRGKATPFESILTRLKVTTSMIALKVWCEGATDVPVFARLFDMYDVHDVVLDIVGGWPGLMNREPERWLDGCREAIIVMDGDNGRVLTKRQKPLTPAAKNAYRSLSSLPIRLYVLERYGIENYFPRSGCEKVLGRDLARYFPIPDHMRIIDHFSEPFVAASCWGNVVRTIRKVTGRGMKSFFPKNAATNEAIAHEMSASDIVKTDLEAIVIAIRIKAQELA
jgi:adenylate kinase family enzyme